MPEKNEKAPARGVVGMMSGLAREAGMGGGAKQVTPFLTEGGFLEGSHFAFGGRESVRSRAGRVFLAEHVGHLSRSLTQRRVQ